MDNIKVGRLRLEVYGSVEELPIDRYNKFSIYCMLAAGIGNDAESVLKHMEDLYKSAHKKDYERLKTQLFNYHHSLNAILNHENMECTAFACLVHSINSVETKDLSEDGLRWVSGRIQKAQNLEHSFKLFRALKKKLRMISRGTSQTK